MIQGYAIYLRTHRETGKQYGGMCWWTKSDQTAEKACKKRWKMEDRDGIRGLFGGFDSQIMLVESRGDAPEMSEGLYRIRIAVDESKIIDAIPPPARLNRVSPLLQLNMMVFNEAMLGVGGRQCRDNGTGLFGMTSERRQNIGRASGRVQGRKCKEEGLGIFAPNFDRSLPGRAGAVVNQKNGTAIFAPGMKAKGGRKSGSAAKENGTGIFAPGFDRLKGSRKAGQKNVESGHLARMNHIQWHVKRGISNPACLLCAVPQGA